MQRRYSLTPVVVRVGMFLLLWTNLNGQTYTEVSDLLGLYCSYGLQSFGGGVSFQDFDQDGWDDLTFATQSGEGLVFFRNNEGVFEEISPPLVQNFEETKQVLWVDYDNDGDMDLFVTAHYGDNILYVNFGDFLMIPYVLPAPQPYSTGPTYGAAFGDYDRDGFLDLLVCNKTANHPIPNQLFHNNGNGTFTEVTHEHDLGSIYQATFCASFIDIDQDLWPDIYTAEDKISVNQLYRNTGNNSFENLTATSGAGIIIDAMCVTTGDFDNDHDLDIYVTNTPGGNALLRNNGNNTFTEIAGPAGVGYYETGWGSCFFDYDHDMDLDLYVSGGTTFDAVPSIFYENMGNGQFTIPPNAGFANDSMRSFSNAMGDINNDGAIDLAISNQLPDSSQLWMSSGPVNNWIKIELEGTVSNRDGIGTWINVYSNGIKQVKFTECGSGYLAQHAGWSHFGLADAGVIDSIIVKWPSGVVDKLVNQSVNQRLFIEEGLQITSMDIPFPGSFGLYPNPASIECRIERSTDMPFSGSIRIFDLNGKLIQTKEWPEGADYHNIDLGSLQEGMYLVEIGGRTSKLLIMR